MADLMSLLLRIQQELEREGELVHFNEFRSFAEILTLAPADFGPSGCTEHRERLQCLWGCSVGSLSQLHHLVVEN